MFTYFIGYVLTYNNGTLVFNNVQIQIPYEIRSMDQVKILQRELPKALDKDTNLKGMTILSFIQL